MTSMKTDLNLTYAKTATFSDDGAYRYALTRSWAPLGQRVAFIGLNPSTADHLVDDPTIRRCVGFATAWGFGSLVMLNLYAYRATDPRELHRPTDPVGPEFDEVFRYHLLNASVIVAAWGSNPLAKGRGRFVIRELLDGRPLQVFATPEGLPLLTASGEPRHPLYLRGDSKLCAFPFNKAGSHG